MSAAFPLMIRGRIHECAPDHSVETITVGALRQAASTMDELYALLEELVDIEGPQPGTAAWAKKVDAALAKARGELS